MLTRHRVLLGLLLIGNTVLFAGVDAPTRAATAALLLVLLFDLRQMPPVPRLFGFAVIVLASLVVLQLLPWPESVRRLLLPGFADLLPSGWRPLSLAPWATARVASSVVIALGIALVASKTAATRTGLPGLLGLMAAVGAALGVLGFAGESHAPDKVLLVRANTGGGDVYGPFVNSNHFAVGIELTLPAAMVLLAVAARHLVGRRQARQRAVVVALASVVVCAICCGAMIRSGSRGGLLFIVAGALITAPLWRRGQGARRWPWAPVVAVVVAIALVLASTQLAVVRDEFSRLLVVEGVEGNTRWDMWQGTLMSWRRAPVAGTGLGSYRHVIGLDKPATGTSALEQAHNDWLEWLSTAGIIGAAALGLALAGLALLLLPGRVRRLRFEYRYPMAGAAFALVTVAIHEIVGFGLQTPLNRYLLAVWIGMMWGIGGSGPRARPQEEEGREPDQE
jgi:hypothetical protein